MVRSSTAAGFQRLRAYLDGHEVTYTVHEHPVALTAQEFAAAEHVRGHMVAKVVLVFAGGEMVMLVLPAPCQVDLARLSSVLGKDVRLAHEEEFTPRFPDCDAGAMPPFGHLYGIPVVVHEQLAENKTVVFQAGTHRHAISLDYEDYRRLVRPGIASFTKLG